MRRFLLLSLLMAFSVLVFAQTRTVTGSVLDETGAVVPFASISEKGTTNGVSADADVAGAGVQPPCRPPVCVQRGGELRRNGADCRLSLTMAADYDAGGIWPVRGAFSFDEQRTAVSVRLNGRGVPEHDAQFYELSHHQLAYADVLQYGSLRDGRGAERAAALPDPGRRTAQAAAAD